MTPLVTSSAETEVKRATPVKLARTWWLWPLRFILDRNDDPSATRIMAYLIIAATWAGHAPDPWTSALCLATCFGYSMFKGVVDKTSMSATATGAVTLAAAVTKNASKIVTENINKAFAYTTTGEPTHSLPEQPDSRTPSGAP